MQYLYRIRSSYWFVPSLMAVGAILLSIAGIVVDTVIGPKWIDDFSWLYANKPEGARQVLSTIAGSMITVAGVTFSITIVSVTNAAGRFGPRILTNFMGDRGNQITLGVFIATFLYCLLILRTVRNGDSPGWDVLMPGGNEPGGGFVPHLSIIVGILLAIASIGVLIYFIHHVPESIHISNVTARIGAELKHKVLDMFPEDVGHEKAMADATKRNEAERFLETLREKGSRVTLERTGYIEQIDEEGLMEIAIRRNLLVEVQSRPGDFIHDRTAVLLVHTMEDVENVKVIREAIEDLRGIFVVGSQRTPTQDVLFLFDELVEIAVIALSPGVNDPYTAITCLHWVGGALAHVANAHFPSPWRYDGNEKLRVMAPALDFEHLIDHLFARLRPHVATEANVARTLLEVLEDVITTTEQAERKEVLRRHGAEFLEIAEEVLDDRPAITRIREYCKRIGVT